MMYDRFDMMVFGPVHMLVFGLLLIIPFWQLFSKAPPHGGADSEPRRPLRPGVLELAVIAGIVEVIHTKSMRRPDKASEWL